MADGSIVSMPRPTAEGITIRIPLTDVEKTREFLAHLEVSAQLGLSCLAKVASYGTIATMAGVKEVFEALSSLMGS